ncbi:MAG TPA: hypothetical protein VF546_25365 [Pyrinomonadaceae bacterium]|jgi:hypothetical protein
MNGQRTTRIIAAAPASCVFGAALLCVLFVVSPDCAAQSRRARGGLPRVGTIKDYPATGLLTGCANLYSHFEHQARQPGADYVFIARDGGDNTWMNLGGRDVRLTQIKRATRRTRTTTAYFYRYGRLRISVLLEVFDPDRAPADDFTLRLRITLRRGRAVRTVRALGYSDC